jgi:hypothetical protein
MYSFDRFVQIYYSSLFFSFGTNITHLFFLTKKKYYSSLLLVFNVNLLDDMIILNHIWYKVSKQFIVWWCGVGPPHHRLSRSVPIVLDLCYVRFVGRGLFRCSSQYIYDLDYVTVISCHSLCWYRTVWLKRILNACCDLLLRTIAMRIMSISKHMIFSFN